MPNEPAGGESGSASLSPSASPSPAPSGPSASPSPSAVIYSASLSVSPSVSPSEPEIIPPVKPVFYRNPTVVFNNAINRDINLYNSDNIIPSWNTSGRPKNIKPGIIGFNFQTESLEVWNGFVWLVLPMKKI